MRLWRWKGTFLSHGAVRARTGTSGVQRVCPGLVAFGTMKYALARLVAGLILIVAEAGL
ncbi:protein of unknown function [Pseudodesulfovibrio piezophilus C1TLV30]|uniref:Uncharacterized protein n=1 Tax=Pseudodesulfovibrio piezophilus (strain DSM 21447 / JCM 15486 / C1TLV30) TaxID=1322246 RepID=M1WR27_PSEP2|nr:protein of unknown function [Pseudodesulfovibrio piezophilus C1TLV30]